MDLTTQPEENWPYYPSQGPPVLTQQQVVAPLQAMPSYLTGNMSPWRASYHGEPVYQLRHGQSSSGTMNLSLHDILQRSTSLSSQQTMTTSPTQDWQSAQGVATMCSHDFNYLPAVFPRGQPTLHQRYPAGSFYSPATNNNVPTGAVFRCKWEGCQSSTSFRREPDLIRHLKSIHIRPDAYACQFDGCTKAYGRKDHLQEHMRRAHSLS
ncbi:hypothetical protein BJY04DRAFT_221454 [Aspergillus karnatakaensis]|uniref:uncharacterized protein n=1 Tax=Aspergillus karnatakaensis TaxID=1810916 RepID=UPI003CCD975C